MAGGAAEAKVLDFWKEVVPGRCALCDQPRNAKRKRWRGRYCSRWCREAVQRGAELWTRDPSNFHPRRATAFRTRWIADARGGLVLFDFADERVVDNPRWYSEPFTRPPGRKAGDWEPSELRESYNAKCRCGTKATHFTVHSPNAWKAWCLRCFRRFAWIPRSRFARWLPTHPLSRGADFPFEEVAERGLHVLRGGRQATVSRVEQPHITPAEVSTSGGGGREIRASETAVDGVRVSYRRSFMMGSVRGFTKADPKVQQGLVRLAAGVLRIPEEQARRELERADREGRDSIEVSW